MNTNWKPLLEMALERRQKLFENSFGDTNCFRLFNGAREGIPGLVIEQFSDVIIFQVFEKECLLDDSALRQIAEWMVIQRRAQSVYKKTFVRDRSHQSAGSEYYSPEPLVGCRSNAEICVQENGLFYEIQPFSGYSTGLFLDQRENRRFLRKIASKKRVLNLFAYTCGFSLACAAEGASTTSVDLSKKYLNWGKRNFEMNQIDLKGHQFMAQDSFEFLKRAEKKGLKYNLIVVDPPSFSRTKQGGVFSLKKDYPRLLRALAPLMEQKGFLFFSCNLSEWDSALLTEKAEEILKESGSWEIQSSPKAPKDFENAITPISQWLAFKL